MKCEQASSIQRYTFYSRLYLCLDLVIKIMIRGTYCIISPGPILNFDGKVSYHKLPSVFLNEKQPKGNEWEFVENTLKHQTRTSSPR